MLHCHRTVQQGVDRLAARPVSGYGFVVWLSSSLLPLHRLVLLKRLCVPNMIAQTVCLGG
jgi:hypothetical protein